ncbi:MAG: glycosyltransferase family 39 protein [Elusimicrobiota bacterium]
MALTWILVIFVLLLGAFLRFYALKQRGLLHFDDGLRMLEVAFLDDLMTFIKKNIRPLLSKKKIGLGQAAAGFRGRYLFDTNPLNIFIYYLTSKVVRNVEYSALYANAFFGIIGILGVYFTGKIIFGPLFAIISALILTVSGYHLVYSRSVHAEITCGAFYVWATYLYLMSCKTGNFIYLIIAGIFVGAAFCCNTRQFYLPVFFAGWEIVAAVLFKFPADIVVSRFILLFTAMALPLIIIEEFFVILKEIGYPYPTFFRQLFFRSGNFVLPTARLPFLRMYLKTIYAFDGPLTILLVFLGAVLLLKNISFEGGVLLSQFFIPLLFWSGRPDISREKALAMDDGTGTYAYALPRLISSSIYSMSIISSTGVMVLLSFFPSVSFLVKLAAALVVITAPGIYKSLKILGIKSGYKSAVEYIIKSGCPKHISFCYPNSEFFAGKENTIDVSYIKSKDELLALYRKQNVRYMLYVKYLHVNTYNRIPLNSLITEIVRESEPVFRVPLGTGKIKPLYWEEHNSPDVQIFENDEIKIYDISKTLSKI